MPFRCDSERSENRAGRRSTHRWAPSSRQSPGLAEALCHRQRVLPCRELRFPRAGDRHTSSECCRIAHSHYCVASSCRADLGHSGHAGGTRPSRIKPCIAIGFRRTVCCEYASTACRVGVTVPRPLRITHRALRSGTHCVPREASIEQRPVWRVRRTPRYIPLIHTGQLRGWAHDDTAPSFTEVFGQTACQAERRLVHS